MAIDDDDAVLFERIILSLEEALYEIHIGGGCREVRGHLVSRLSGRLHKVSQDNFLFFLN